MNVYLATPRRADLAVVLAVCSALAVFGCRVALPAAPSNETPDAEVELSIAATDLATLLMADYVVVMPGAEGQWEVTMAPAYGVPTISLAEFAELAPEL